MDDGKGEFSSQLWLELVLLCYVWLHRSGLQIEATVLTGSIQMNILFCNLSEKEKSTIFCAAFNFYVHN